MPNEQKTTKEWFFKNTFAIVGTLVVMANVWLAYKLFPIVSDIKDIGAKIIAQGNEIANTKSQCQSSLSQHISQNNTDFSRFDNGLTIISNELKSINTRLSKIEGKLEK
jgi:septal ring factor EnvC (AmiA/AmiB activator)